MHPRHIKAQQRSANLNAGRSATGVAKVTYAPSTAKPAAAPANTATTGERPSIAAMTKNAGGHLPVLKNEILKLFEGNFPGRFLDMTFGGGGHTTAILEAHPENKVVAIDCDPAAKVRSKAISEKFGNRFEFVASFFDELEGKTKGTFDGILMDLGVSSYQFDTPERGFSFKADAPLDMRMNPNAGQPAWELLEKASVTTLEHIVRDIAEERHWKSIVQKILGERASGKLRTTQGLINALFGSKDGDKLYHAQGHRIHPATRLFMGLRIAVNRESERLVAALPWGFRQLSTGGVLAVISFHSGEDRVVKHFVKELITGETCAAESLIRKVQEPTNAECEANPRSRSAKLRAVKKITEYTKQPEVVAPVVEKPVSAYAKKMAAKANKQDMGASLMDFIATNTLSWNFTAQTPCHAQ